MAAQEDLSEQIGPVDSRVRTLVEGILSAREIAGAPQLREQLNVAMQAHWGDEFTTTAHFKVPDDLPRAVPHNQMFPVRAQFIGPAGATQQIVLQIFDGQLDHLAANETAPESADSVGDFLLEWPDPSEVVYVIDSADGASTSIVSPS